MSRQPLRWLGGNVEIRVQVNTGLSGSGLGIWDVSQWDVGRWNDSDPQWNNITHYVEAVTINRGRERYGERNSAGTCTIQFDNSSGVFTPGAFAHSSLWNLPWRPGRLIRVVAVLPPYDGTNIVPLFTGRLEASDDSYGPGGAGVKTTVVAYDALADLHNCNPLALTSLGFPMTGIQMSHERVHAALDRMGWPQGERLIQAGNHRVQTSELAQTVLEECMRAAEAEGGELFADTRNRIVFKTRDWLLGGNETIQAYHEETLRKGPLALWSFSGAAATADLTGNGHTLTFSGSPATQQEGITADDESVLFDGTNDYATAANPAGLTVEDDMSIEFWFKPLGDGPVQTILLAEPDDLSHNLVEIRYEGDTETLFVGPWSDAHTTVSMPVLPQGEWYHVVVTYDWHGEGREVKCYVNGQLTDHFGSDFMPEITAPLTWYIGGTGDPDFYYEGYLSELAVYDYVLTEADVLSQYEAHKRDLNERAVVAQAYFGYDDDEVPEGALSADIQAVDSTWDLQFVRNEIQFSKRGGTAYTVEDADSIVKYGRQTYRQLDFINEDQEDVEFLADRYLAIHKEADRRVNSVTVVPKDGSDNEVLWGLEFGDLVQVRVPTLHGWSQEGSYHIVGVTHEITADEWRVTYKLDDSFTLLQKAEDGESS